MMVDYQQTTLWTTALSGAGLQTERQRDLRNDLLSALRALECRVTALLDKIDESCRGLTIHDITHVHQLWSVASEVCGPDYPLNPLEGFVLGAAFLIHDAGLTAAAYPGGLPALENTNYYKDRVAALLRTVGNEPPTEESPDNPSAEIRQRALFDTLRAIHAKRAETLLEYEQPHPLTGQQYRLLSDPDLFLDCGAVIGRVAASHHWNIDDVDERFRDPLTAPASFPGWSIDGVKLACILRASDACAIDERRARIMPFLLSRPTGVSRDHWIFQSNLKPAERRAEALVFQSKQPFNRDQMSAWWIAYDAIRIADRELRDCDRLLRDRAGSGKHPSLKPFSARRVEGAGEPSHLKNIVEVRGWTPVDTAVRIDNPISLIEKLGGWHLYGNDVSAPLREALQNAADAIRARRRRNGYIDKSAYPGRIDITFDYDPSDQNLSKLKMMIADDGVGMWPGTMTGALLDFGRSFWDSAEAAEKYPGLLSDPQFQPTGKFGIGFYSIFMVADDVKVVSRPWEAGERDRKTLHFRNGAKDRAEFRSFAADEDGDISPKYSTALIANVKLPGWISRFASLSDYGPFSSMSQLWKNVTRTLKQLVFSLDVECWLSCGGTAPERLNQPGILELPADQFVRCFNDTFVSPTSMINKGISAEETALIEPIRDRTGAVHTLGCINTTFSANGVWHIGGFHCFGIVNPLIKGVVGGKPLTASRHSVSRLGSEEELGRWGKSQLARIVSSNVDPMAKLSAIANLTSIDVDIRQHAMVIADGKARTVQDIVANLPRSARIFIMGQRTTLRSSAAIFTLEPNFPFFGFSFEDLRHLQHSVRIAGSAVSGRESYFEIEGTLDAPTNSNTAYGALCETLRNAGFQITTEPPGEYLIGIYRGPKGGRSYLLSRDLIPGKEIKSYGFVLNANREEIAGVRPLPQQKAAAGSSVEGRGFRRAKRAARRT